MVSNYILVFGGFCLNLLKQPTERSLQIANVIRINFTLYFLVACLRYLILNLSFFCRNRSSLRASLKGFCQDMLQQDKLTIPVPDVVDAVINFDEDASSIEQDDERENSIEYISVANVKVYKVIIYLTFSELEHLD